MIQALRQPRTILAAAAAAAISLAGCSSAASSGSGSAQAPAPAIKVAYMPDPHGAGLLAVAQDQGFFATAGITVNAMKFTAGPPEIAAMAGGSVDIAYLGPGALFEPAAGKATIITLDSINYGDAIIADPGIRSVADLKGKTVGYVPKTSSQMILQIALRQSGLTMSDIKPVQLSSTTTPTAFDTGHIQAAALWQPAISQMSGRVPGSTILATDRTYQGLFTAPQMWVVSNSFLKAHPARVRKFLEAWILADNYRIAHPGTLVQDTYKYIDGTTPVTALQAQVSNTNWLTGTELASAYGNGQANRWLTSLEQQLTAIGIQPSVVPPSQFTDWSAFQQAEQHLPA